jgi:hypothetical protein
MAVRPTRGVRPRDVRHKHPRFQGDNFDRNLQIVEAVGRPANRIAPRKGR